MAAATARPACPRTGPGEYVDDVIAVLDAVGVSSSALVGYSAGARIAYAVARAYPGRFSAVAGCAVGAPGEDAGDWAETAARVRGVAHLEPGTVQEPGT